MSETNSLINLESILDFSSKLNDSLSVNFILSSAMLSLMGKLKLSKICSFLFQNGAFQQVLSKGVVEQFENIKFDTQENFARISPDNPDYLALHKAGLRSLLVLRHSRDILAVIAMNNNMIGRDFTEEEIEYAKIVAVVTASSISNAQNYEKVHLQNESTLKKNLLLSNLIEISKDFTYLFDSAEDLFRLFSRHLMGQLRLSKYALILKRNQQYEISVNKLDTKIPTSIFDELEKLPICTLTNDLPNSIQRDLNLAGVTAISPMKYQNANKGFVLIGTRLDGIPFTTDELLFAEIFANTLIASYEINRLVKEEIEKKKIENELKLARDIQTNLLPFESPAIDGFDVYGMTKPSKEVGGDYFDFVEINPNEFLIIIADISGKGVPAALLMANLQAAIRTLSFLDLTLDSILQNINKLIYNNSASDKFATIFISKIDCKTGTFEYINAGHNPPILLCRNGKLKELTTGGILVGILPEVPPFETEKIDLTQKDTILLYTDGISEAMDINDKEFGTKRIESVLLKNTRNSSKELTLHLLQEVMNFSGKAEQHDDITLISIIKK